MCSTSLLYKELTDLTEEFMKLKYQQVDNVKIISRPSSKNVAFTFQYYVTRIVPLYVPLWYAISAKSGGDGVALW